MYKKITTNILSNTIKNNENNKDKTITNKKEYYLLFIALFFIFYFLYKSFYRNIELNWIAPPIILLFPFITFHILKHKKITIFAFFVSFTLSLLIRFPYILPQDINPHTKLHWYKQSSNLIIQAIKNDNSKTNNRTTINICGDYYSSASLLQYYTQTSSNANINFNIIEPLTPTRKSDIDLWSDYSLIKNCYIIKRGLFNNRNKFCKKSNLIQTFDYKKINNHNIDISPIYRIYKCERN